MAKNKLNHYEVIVIGTGPAGVSASIYTSRAKLKTLIIGRPKDGALYKAHIVANYFGFAKGITGPHIMERSMTQTKKFGTKFHEGEVINSTIEKDVFHIKVENGKVFTADNIVIATGKSYKILGAINEKKLSGKGVHYCSTCDGTFYTKKKIAVIGHSNLAAEEALTLLSYTTNITIFSNGLDFKFSDFLRKRIKKSGIVLRKDKVVKCIGNDKLEKLELENGEQIPFDGAFMALGRVSALNFATRLAIKVKNDEIVINRNGETDVKGVYAAGNCTGGNAQAANSVGEGCNAALSIIKKVQGIGVYIDYE